MPTTNPRINVTLSPSLDLVVSRMATHQRVSKSQVLRELLEAAEPALQRAVALMDAAKTASTEARAGLARRMDRGIEHAEDAMAVILSRLERAETDLVSQAEAVKGRRPARQPGGARSARPGAALVAVVPGNPPASNRGVKSPRKGKKGAPNRATKRGGS
jgi:hypothetical protein